VRAKIGVLVLRLNKKMEHALREFARSRFSGALGAGAMARNCERSVYNWAVQETRASGDDSSWENKIFKWRYKQKVVGLIQEMGRGQKVEVILNPSSGGVKVTLNCIPQLVHRLQRKELEAKSIARYPAEILWPEGPKSCTMFKLSEKDMIMEGARAKEQDYEGLFKCGKCKSTKTTYYQMQTRSADEPSAFCNSFEFEIMFPTDARLFFVYSDHLCDLQIVLKPLEVLIYKCYSRVISSQGDQYNLVLKFPTTSFYVLGSIADGVFQS